jgi:thiamine monophosphate synthase
VVVENIFALGLRNAEDVDLVQVAFNAASLFQVRARRKSENERREAAERLRQLAQDILQLAQDLEQ